MATTPLAFAVAVLDNPYEAADIELAHDVHVRPVAHLEIVCGFTYECSSGHRHVFVREELCCREQQVTYWHEVYHCLAPDGPEQVAEEFALRVARAPQPD
jgi:hypothetical protein